MSVLAHLAPAGPQPRAGWECPRCQTVYSPDIEACRCATTKPLSERVRTSEAIRLVGGACICMPFGVPGTVPCPVHQPAQPVQVIF